MVDVWLLAGGRFWDTAQVRVAALATWPLTSPGRDGASPDAERSSRKFPCQHALTRYHEAQK